MMSAEAPGPLTVQAIDEHAAQLLRQFTAHRREALRELLDKHCGYFDPDLDLDLLVDQIYGTLWYRLLLGHASLDDTTAGALANTVLTRTTDTATKPGPNPDDLPET
nr:TetR/AcrR family transcriptional regulator C-terminal ligand-binding domain-containing protein [Sciscionella marina]